MELVTLGQRRGLGLPGGGPTRYAVAVDVAGATVTVGSAEDLLVDDQEIVACSWVDHAVSGEVLVQCSAHGAPRPAVLEGSSGGVRLRWDRPQRRVAPGQSVVLYDTTDRFVLGGGVAA